MLFEVNATVQELDKFIQDASAAGVECPFDFKGADRDSTFGSGVYAPDVIEPIENQLEEHEEVLNYLLMSGGESDG